MRVLTFLSCFVVNAAAAQVIPVPELKLPAGLSEREISIPGGPVALPGTITVPAGKGPFPALVLIHGSGAGDRDETIYGNKPFRDIAWGLAERGILVIRFDKRAKVQPMWYADKAFTVADEVTIDALNALTFLRAQPEVNTQKTFLMGLSLGGMLAPKLALADGKLAGIIIASGATRMKLADQMNRQFEFIIASTGKDSALARAQLKAAGQFDVVAQLHKLKPADTLDSKPLPGLGGTGAKYWIDLNSYDPAATMKQVKIPALVIQGMRDYQVPPEQLDDWLVGVGSGHDITVKRYPTLTHILTPGTGAPNPKEYLTPQRVDAQVMIDIMEWIKKR